MPPIGTAGAIPQCLASLRAALSPVPAAPRHSSRRADALRTVMALHTRKSLSATHRARLRSGRRSVGDTGYTKIKIRSFRTDKFDA